MTIDFENIWIRGGQPVQTEWLDGCAQVDVSILNWEKLAILRCGGTELSIETAPATPSGHWMRVSGLIDGAAAGSRGNIGWCITGDTGVEVPATIAVCWSEAWLAWRHGEIDDHMLADRLIRQTTSSLESSVRLPLQSRLAVKSPIRWQLLLMLLSTVALGFLAGWISCTLRKCIHVSSPPTYRIINSSTTSEDLMIQDQTD